MFDIRSDATNLIAFYKPIKPIDTKDMVALFKDIASCIQTLREEQLALEKYTPSSFCKSAGSWQVCQISPLCPVVKDPSGKLVSKNMKDIALQLFKEYPRAAHAFNHITDISDLQKHPMAWDFWKETCLLACITLDTPRDCLQNLDSKISSFDSSGEVSWIVCDVIARDAAKRKYDKSSFWDLVDYMQDKIIRFNKCSPEIGSLFSTPQGVIDYFNKNVSNVGGLQVREHTNRHIVPLITSPLSLSSKCEICPSIKLSYFDDNGKGFKKVQQSTPDTNKLIYIHAQTTVRIVNCQHE